MAIAKKKTEATTTSRVAARPQSDRSVFSREAAGRGAMQPSYEDVSRRAFEIWEQSGRPHGHDLENWLQAESELRGATS